MKLFNTIALSLSQKFQGIIPVPKLRNLIGCEGISYLRETGNLLPDHVAFVKDSCLRRNDVLNSYPFLWEQQVGHNIFKSLVITLVFIAAMFHQALAQSNDAPLNPDYYHQLERYEVRSGQLASTFDTNVKPYSRQGIGSFLDSLTFIPASSVDRFNLHYLIEDNWPYVTSEKANIRKPVLKYFYKHSRSFWSVEENALHLTVNPVMHFQVGNDGTNGLSYINTRGIQVEGMIDNKIGFYTYIGENQMQLPGYVNEYVRRTLTVPQEGFWKGLGNDGVDFLTARGHISIHATRHIGLQLGHGKHFIGNGYRSLILSDFANNYLYFRINTQVWKLHYTNIFAKMTADVIGNQTGLYGTVAFPAKYFVFHRLGIDITKKLNIGVYESIVSGDSTQRFDFNYLNPVIFYRAIEQQGGSVGNALLGIDFKWLLLNHLSLYGQALIDEFVINEIRAGQGWWGNKYALQLGLKYVDVLNIPNLDMQFEFNRVRPYTYAHEGLYTSYTHYEQPLAHPLGANFRETLAIIRYQPLHRLHLKAKLIGAVYGADTATSNWGNNILLDNRTRQQEYGNILKQGVKTDLLIADLTASYHLWHNLFVDMRYIDRRRRNATRPEQEMIRFISIGLRLNIAPRDFDF